MRKSIALLLCLFVAAALFAGGQKQAAPASNKIYRAAIEGDWEHIDIHMTTNDYTVGLNIFDRLVEAAVVGDGISDIVPGLATSWKVSPDGKVYTFQLRKGVKFHNGEIFKADDVKYTFERMLNPLKGGRNTDVGSVILGAEDMLAGKTTTLKGIKVINDYEVEFTLEEAYAPFLANMATPGGSIYNRKATEAAGLEFGIDPKKTCGTGPYYLSEWVPNSHTVILAFKDYWGGPPKNDGVRWQCIVDASALRMMFENGELDEIDFDGGCRPFIPDFRNSPKWKNQIVYGYRVGTYYYHINQNIKPFDDVRIRKAFQMSIDRQALLNSPLFQGLGTVQHGIFPPGLIGYNPNLPPIKYDPEAAKKLMAEAGYPNGFDMVITQIADSPATLARHELVQAMLAKVGIKAEIKQMDSASWFAVRGKGELATYTSSWSADFNDPDNFIYTFFTPRNTVNRSFNYKNQDAMRRIEQARFMTDPVARVKEYQALEKLVIQDDACWVPLFALQHLWVVQPWIKNFQPLWNGWSGNFFKDIEITR